MSEKSHRTDCLNSVGEINFRYAKDLAGIPRSQQPVRQWIVTGDEIWKL